MVGILFGSRAKKNHLRFLSFYIDKKSFTGRWNWKPWCWNSTLYFLYNVILFWIGRLDFSLDYNLRRTEVRWYHLTVLYLTLYSAKWLIYFNLFFLDGPMLFLSILIRIFDILVVLVYRQHILSRCIGDAKSLETDFWFIFLMISYFSTSWFLWNNF